MANKEKRLKMNKKKDEEEFPRANWNLKNEWKEKESAKKKKIKGNKMKEKVRE